VNPSDYHMCVVAGNTDVLEEEPVEAGRTKRYNETTQTKQEGNGEDSETDERVWTHRIFL